MKFFINVIYNNQGQKLTNKNKHTFSIESEYKPKDAELKDIVYKEVPEALVENYSIDANVIFNSLKIGDYICVHTFDVNSRGEVWGEGDTMHKIVEMTDDYIAIDDYNGKFDYRGIQICRKKKNIPYLTIPSKEAIKYRKEHDLCSKYWSEIVDIVDGVKDNIDDPYEPTSWPTHCDSFDLKEILDILKNNKNKEW